MNIWLNPKYSSNSIIFIEYNITKMGVHAGKILKLVFVIYMIKLKKGGKMKRIKWNYDLVKDFVETEGYCLISESYTKIEDKMTFKCNQGHMFEMKFNNFKNGNRCKKCRTLSRMKYSENEVRQILQCEGYELLDVYTSLVKPIRIKCPNGHINDILFQSFENGHRCKNCSEDEKNPLFNNFKESDSRFNCGNKKLTIEQAKERADNVGFVIIDNYFNGIKSNVNFKCDKGHIFNSRFDGVIRRKKCPVCSENGKVFSYKYVSDYIKSKGDTLISKQYSGINDKLEIKCNNGHLYKVTFQSFRHSNTRCPICYQTKGENKIYNFLVKNKILNMQQYKFEDCKNKKELPFDFYLPEYNLCIEYDGIQHFKPVDFFGGEESFIKTQQRDAIKNDYCKKNNINLLRIPYLDFDNIENILKEKLNIKNTNNE